MARSLPYPWIKANFIEILKPTNVAGKKKPFKNAPKVLYASILYSTIAQMDNIRMCVDRSSDKCQR